MSEKGRLCSTRIILAHTLERERGTIAVWATRSGERPILYVAPRAERRMAWLGTASCISGISFHSAEEMTVDIYRAWVGWARVARRSVGLGCASGAACCVPRPAGAHIREAEGPPGRT